MLPYERARKKINILDNIDRSSVCLTAVVIFAQLRWGGGHFSAFYFTMCSLLEVFLKVASFF